MLMVKVLYTDFDYESVMRSASKDWERDTRGIYPSLNRSMFESSMFEIVDLW
jgi:hypothetical protein